MNTDTIVRTREEKGRTTNRNALGQKVQRGMQQTATSGRWPFAVPLGYVSQRVGKERQIVLEPTVAPLIQQAFFLAAEGKQPPSTLLQRMTERGMVSKEGQPLLRLSAFLRLLTNPFYAGRLHFQGKVTAGIHPALIDADCFERVQQNLALRPHTVLAISEKTQ